MTFLYRKRSNFMIHSYDGLFLPVFRARHFQTDGRVENIIEALNVIGQEWVGLCLAQGYVGEYTRPIEYWKPLVDLAGRAIRRLKRREVYCDLVIPGAVLLQHIPGKVKSFVDTIYQSAASTGVDTIWVDDSQVDGCYSRSQLRDFYRQILNTVTRCGKEVRLGLIARSSGFYSQAGLTQYEVADILAGDYLPLLGLGETGCHDYDRTAILKSAQYLAESHSKLPAEKDYETVGIVWNQSEGGFHKSAESIQMQTNLNCLYGVKGGLFDVFDRMGTAPGSDNLYLKMIRNNTKLINKLAKLTGHHSEPMGITVVQSDADNHLATGRWSEMLWRMGMPVRFIQVSDLKPDLMPDSVYILTGSIPDRLSSSQLESVFHHGVLLDAGAAESIQNTLKRSDLLGIHVEGRIPTVATEILSDHGFATVHYGYESLYYGLVEQSAFKKLTLAHERARAITALVLKDQTPNATGMVLFDNIEKRQRCAVIPWSLTENLSRQILTVPRQRHIREILAWLYRAKLPCMVENTPDLIPFWVRVTGKKRLLLGLLNISFDWAIQSRIRLNRIPFKVKRVRHLTDSGRLEELPGLSLQQKLDYQYIQLQEDTAVAPMQMTILVVEG